MLFLCVWLKHDKTRFTLRTSTSLGFQSIFVRVVGLDFFLWDEVFNCHLAIRWTRRGCDFDHSLIGYRKGMVQTNPNYGYLWNVDECGFRLDVT